VKGNEGGKGGKKEKQKEEPSPVRKIEHSWKSMIRSSCSNIGIIEIKISLK